VQALCTGKTRYVAIAFPDAAVNAPSTSAPTNTRPKPEISVFM
jgi:hypothetical protein